MKQEPFAHWGISRENPLHGKKLVLIGDRMSEFLEK